MRKAGDFAKAKVAYLEKKKAQGYRTTKALSSSSTGPQTKGDRAPSLSARKKVVSNTSSRRIDSFAHELTFKIFSYLDVKSLLVCASTCKRWEAIANDNLLWKSLYIRHVYVAPRDGTENYVKEPAAPLQVDNKYWKTRFFTDSKTTRNRRFLRQRKINQYTGVTDRMKDILEKLGAKFQLSIRSKEGGTSTFIERKRMIYCTLTLVQWYTLKSFPKLSEISGIEIFSLTPIIITQRDGCMMKNGPKSKSLVFSETFDSEFTPKRLALCDQIQTFVSSSGLLISVWKDTDEIAFIWATLHHYNLLSKCLSSTQSVIYRKPHNVKPDDVSPLYGLQGYKIHVQLCIGDGTWNELFHSDIMSQCKYSKYFTLTSARDVGTFCSTAFENAFLHWKTDLFDGKMEHLVLLSISVVDINSEVLWHVSRPVKCEIAKQRIPSFDSESDSTIEITHCDEVGKIELIFDALKCGYSFDRIILQLNFSVINVWFGTNH